ncbi:fumarylacetoacetate hydrolase family protein [Herbiconiux sp. P16]|uniref:fumarylacetoacetate hydrolase family protein n=1 Tax=Herbiconiux wuyangfengii TaxID=3342794 RepID=UPI0035B7BA5A
MQFIGIERNSERWVAAVTDGGVRPVAAVEAFWSDPDGWSSRVIDDASAPLERSTLTEVPLVPDSARVLCIGLNYRAHVAEGPFSVPEHPTIFGRWTASLSVGGVAAPIPTNEPGLDWEGEVAVYIGRAAHAVTEANALEHVFGFSTFNDLTARTAQKLTTQWTLGKNGDRSGPAGPLVTRDEVGDLKDGLDLRTRVNGIEVQHGNTRDLIFTVESIIALVSQTLTLRPGDVIVTGTPEGVGYARTPPWFLQPGDVVEIEVERLGVLSTPIVAATDAPDEAAV